MPGTTDSGVSSGAATPEREIHVYHPPRLCRDAGYCDFLLHLWLFRSALFTSSLTHSSVLSLIFAFLSHAYAHNRQTTTSSQRSPCTTPSCKRYPVTFPTCKYR